MSDSSWKNIEEIKKGDKVFIENGHYEVTNVFDNGEQEVIKILAEDNKWIECTPNHRWYVYNHSKDEMQCVEAQHLLSDNYYFAEERKNNIDQFGKYKLTKIINIFYEEKIKRVYDIEVEQVHMFTAKNPDTELKAISHNSAMISLSNLSDDRMRNQKRVNGG
jgi:intein/homing endonuclease